MTLADLFTPDRVAVIGATDRQGSIGRALVTNLLGEFDGTVVPVNPNRETLFDRPCYPSVTRVPEPVDLAIVVVPAGAVLDVVGDAADAGVDNVVVISAGFGETDEAGREREHRLTELADERDLTLIGPNSLGVIGTERGLNATFGEGSASPGNVSFLSQSGALITSVLGWTADMAIGFDRIVSLGNEAVVDEVDLLESWGDEPATDVILGYVEDVADGRRFVETADQVTRDTPVVLLKSGRTAAGADAVASHTGSLAGSDRAYDAAFRETGVIRADSLQQLFDYGQVLAGQEPPPDGRVAIVTNAGGPGVLAADAVADSDLQLAEFDGDTRDRLRTALPETATPRNPLDVIGDADLDRFRETITAAADATTVDAVLVIACPTAVFDHEKLATLVGDIQSTRDVAVVGCLMGGTQAERATSRLDHYGIPNFFDPARAVDALDALATYGRTRGRTRGEPTAPSGIDHQGAAEILRSARRAGRTQLGAESMGLLDAYGIPTPDGRVVETPTAAGEVAGQLDGPVVVKIVSPAISHKSDVGGVAVGLEPDDVADTAAGMLDRARAAVGSEAVIGVQVQELVDTDEAVETIVGCRVDPQFGPLALFGLGGLFVETLDDTTLRIAPVTEATAHEMTADIDAAPLLRGARGQPGTDIDRVADVIRRLSHLAADLPVTDVEINPLVAGPERVTAVDFRGTLVDADDVDDSTRTTSGGATEQE